MASLGRLFREDRFDAEFIHGLNEAAQVMRQDLAKSFVNLRRAGLASQAVAKLRQWVAEQEVFVCRSENFPGRQLNFVVTNIT